MVVPHGQAVGISSTRHNEKLPTMTVFVGSFKRIPFYFRANCGNITRGAAVTRTMICDWKIVIDHLRNSHYIYLINLMCKFF